MTNVLKSLPDRTQFFESFSQHISSGKETNKVVAVLVIRIARLHEINAKYGYAAGDKILSEVLKRIDTLRRTGDTLGRITGTDFGLILASLRGVGQAILAAEKIIKISKKGIVLDGENVKIKVAVGIAMFPEHGSDIENLIKFAEEAAIEVENHIDRYKLYSGEDDATTQLTLLMEGELETAIANGSIQLHYQPKLNLTTREFVGVEALARWSTPTRGMLPPDIFVDLAEKTGLIQPLTMLTMNIALRECRELQQTAPGCSVAVNLSATILREEEILDLIMRALDVWNFSPKYLTLEVTENAVMTDTASSLQTLERLSYEGIKISVDDFGTGQSSLRYLKSLPLNELKIDKSFVMNMTDNKDDIKIASAIIDLSHNFDLSVVAEGIENEETMVMLSELGCEYGQGFFIAKPMPLKDLVSWIKIYAEGA